MADGSGATLAQLLRRLRLSAGLTQEELAEAAGISARSVSDLERGITRTTRKDTARLIADALRLSGPDREMFEATARGRIPDGHPDIQHDAGKPPIPPAPLVGRADNVRTVCRLLRRPDIRLVTITGLGGVGKTRAALDIGPRLAADFPDGIFFVNLAAVRDSRLIMASIAQATGIRDCGPEPVEQRVADRLRPLHALLLIDNFEQLVDAADVLSRCLAAARHQMPGDQQVRAAAEGRARTRAPSAPAAASRGRAGVRSHALPVGRVVHPAGRGRSPRLGAGRGKLRSSGRGLPPARRAAAGPGTRGRPSENPLPGSAAPAASWPAHLAVEGSARFRRPASDAAGDLGLEL